MFTRRRTRSTLWTIVPLLTLVWTSLPLHHCNLAMAGPARSAIASTAPSAVSPTHVEITPVPCSHHAADGATAPKAPKALVSCSDLGRAGPDLRPTLTIDPGLVLVSFDSHWHDRASQPVLPPHGPRPLDDGRWRLRPLHLQKSVLLI